MKHTRIVNENSHVSFSMNQYFLYSFLGKIWIYNSRKTLSIRFFRISNSPNVFASIIWKIFRRPIWDKTSISKPMNEFFLIDYSFFVKAFWIWTDITASSIKVAFWVFIKACVSAIADYKKEESYECSKTIKIFNGFYQPHTTFF